MATTYNDAISMGGGGRTIPDYYFNQPTDPAAGWSPYPGMPGRPGYIPTYDPFTMSLSNWAQPQLDQTNLDTSGLDEYKKEALRTGPSAWAQLAGSQQDVESNKALADARAQSAAKQADAESSMAMRGGVDSGARERIARSGMQDYLSNAQGIEGQKMTNKMQIGLNDEQNRISQLGALPGMENQAFQSNLQKVGLSTQARQADIANMMNDATNRNVFNMSGYHEQMTAIGADKQANATANSGKK